MTHEAPDTCVAELDSAAKPDVALPHTMLGRRPILGFLLTYTLTVGSLALVGYLWGKLGFDILVVAMGWPHVLLGLAFNLDRIGRADRKSVLMFVGLLLISLAIGVGHTLVSITSYIYLYFMIHAFRDEIFIYRQRGSGYRFRGRIFDSSGWALFIGGGLLALVGQAIPRDPELQLKWYYLQFAAAAVLSALALIRRPRRLFERWPGLRQAIPIFMFVIAAMTAMKYLRLHERPAPIFFAFLVVFHYFSWYVFSYEKMAARPVEARPQGHGRTWIQRLSTPRGFTTAIVAMNVLSFLGAWGYQIAQVSLKLAYGFEMRYFLYFLVLHVTTSFIPRSLTRIAATPSVRWQREAAG